MKMKIESLNLANFRGFDQIEMKFEPDVTLIAGVNGVGKSGILNAITTILSNALPEFTLSREKPLSFKSQDIQYSKQKVDVASIISIDELRLHMSIQRLKEELDRREYLQDRLKKIEIQIRRNKYFSEDMKPINELDIEKKSILKMMSEKGDQWNFSPINFKPKQLLFNDLYSAEEETQYMLNTYRKIPNQPLVIFFSTQRRLPVQTIQSERAMAFSTAKAFHKSLMDRQVELKEFVDWWRVVESGVTSAHTRRADILYKLRDVVRQFMPECNNLYVDDNRFVVEKNGALLDTNQLSDGERGLLAMLFDITRRLAIANPELNDPISEGSAIIIIDEIELHLHPLWQREVLRKFTDIFKNCQFICTTHSPQVIGEVKKQCLRVLVREDDRIILWRPQRSLGLDSNRVLKELMHVDDRNEDVDNTLKKLFRYISSKNITEAKRCIDDLIPILGKDDPELTRAYTFMEFLEGEK